MATAVDEVELKLVSLELVDGTEIETEAGPDTDSKGTDGSNFEFTEYGNI